MSQLDSTNAGGIYEEKPSSNIYTALLGIAFLALCTASALLAMELGQYDYDTKAENARKVNVRSAEALRAEQQALTEAPEDSLGDDAGTEAAATTPDASLTPAAPTTPDTSGAAPAGSPFGAAPAATPAAPATTPAAAPGNPVFPGAAPATPATTPAAPATTPATPAAPATP